MSANEEWAAKLVGQVDPKWDAEAVEVGYASLQRRVRRRRVVRAAGVVGALSASVLVALVWLAPNTESVATTGDEEAPTQVPTAPVELEPAEPVILGSHQEPVTFADGSTVHPLGDARIRVNEAGVERVAVALERGAARVEVTPRPEREFVVQAGTVRVTVIGTAFEVTRVAEDQTRVEVSRGRVRVDWPGGSEELTDGEVGDYPKLEGEPSPTEPASGETSAPSPRRRDWRATARRGQYDEAYSILETQGERAVRDQVDDLLLAADAARLSGHPARALVFLGRIERRHRDDRRAPMAAFTRGRLELAAGRAGRAASAFENAMTLGAQGSLRENALARAVEAHRRSGNGERAKTLAERYVERYPSGRWTAAVRRHGDL